jgi:hypothetical protein
VRSPDPEVYNSVPEIYRPVPEVYSPVLVSVLVYIYDASDT